MARRLVRAVAVAMFFVLGSATAMSAADAAALPQATLKFSSVRAFVKSLFADAVRLPQQPAGTAAGKGGAVSASATRAGKGSGHAPGKGVGEVPAYGPLGKAAAPGSSGRAPAGFDAKTSTRNARKSDAFSTWFDNADGSYTVKTSQTPANYRAADGSWQPIDAGLVRGADGRLHQKANGIGVSFADGGPASQGSSKASASTSTDLVSLAPGGSERVSWSLAGAAQVSPIVSGATVRYDGILPATNLSLTSEDWGVKESLALSSASAPNSWTFPLALSGVSLKNDPTYGWELIDASGAVVGRLSTPFAYDSVTLHAQHPNTTYAVSYSLTTDESGAQSLVMTLDKKWLDDPARAFPVTVDPTVTVGDAGVRASTYIEYPFSNNYSSTGQLLSGFSDWSSPTVKARSFIYFDTMPLGSGYHVTQANVGIFDIWASTCTPEPFDVYPITDPNWSGANINTQLTWNDTTYTGPATGPSMGEVSASPGAACTNNSGDPSTGTWLYPQLNTSILNQWTTTDPGAYHGIQISAPSESNDLEWKIFDSTAVSSNSPYIYITYSPNSPPQVNSTSPASGYNSPTLTPVLKANGSDPDNWPGQGLGYEYRVYDGANDQLVADSDSAAKCGADTKPSAGSSWTVPAGKLKWGQSYYWSAVACDGYAWSSWAASSALVTAVPPPLLTSSLSQNSSGHGFDPALGNYTASATDAQVATVGPPLAITRVYNSLDPRTAQALGAGWSSLLDARATEQYDTSGSNVQSVTVTYPDGSQVGFGKNSDGSFAAPLGRFASFTAVSGGYTLTDKNDTVYRFTQSLGSGVYGLTSITDAPGRALTATWTSGRITTLTSVSGRALHLAWSLPPGAKNSHVQSIATDPVTANGATAPLTWTYYYQGDRLASVCDPTQSSTCTGAATDVSTKYGYQSGSQYRTAQLDGGPLAYWPLSETSGSKAGDLVLANEHGKDATYSNVALSGAADDLAGSSATAPTFNGTSSQVSTSGKVLDTTASFTVSAWAKLTSTGGWADVVAQDATNATGFELQYDITDNAWAFARDNSDNAPVSIKAHASSAPTVGTWYFLAGVYDAAAGTLKLYVNGALAGSANDSTPVASSGPLTIGRGKWNGQSGDWFPGSISDVAVYQTALPAATISGLYQVGTTANALLTSVTRPSGDTAAQISYSTVTGRVTGLTDANGGNWAIGDPTVSGSAEGYRAAVMGSAPSGYWRLGDAAQSTAAYDEVAPDNFAMAYNNVTLGVSGPLNSSQRAASFNGSSSAVATGSPVLDTTKSFSVSAWATLASTGSFQDVVAQDGSQATGFELQYDPTDSAWAFSRATGDVAGAGSVKVHASSKPSTNTWYHLVGVYNASNKAMSLYVNGQLAGSGTAVTPIAAKATLVIGRGRYNGTSTVYFNGSIAEVAVYPGVLDGATVAAMYAAGKNASGLNPTETVTVTDPGSKTLTYEYDPVNGTRLVAQTDGTGAKTTYGYDTSGFLHTVVDANGNETITGHDPRGNTVSQTTCQHQATNACSTSYFTYYPDDTSAQLTKADPRNDVLLTSSDGRSSSPSDATYRTVYGYDGHGNRVSVVSPPVPGYPGGRIPSTLYTDGTMTYPASDDSSKPVPPGLPWKQTSAGGSVTQYNYYADGDLYSVTSPTGNQTTYFRYDELGRPTYKNVGYNTGLSCTIVNGVIACPFGSLTTITSYDGLNRAVAVTAPVGMDRVTGDVHQTRTTAVYDVDGNRVSQTQTDVGGSTTPDAPRTTLTHYNSYDQPDWAMDAQQYIDGNGAGASPNLSDATQYQYDAYGNKKKVTSAQDQNGRSNVTDYTYDADGRLQYTILENYTGSPSGSSPAASLTEEARSYDPAGRLASVTDSMGFASLYKYYDDDLTATITRCSAVTATNGTATCTGSSFVQESDTYDGAGNLLARMTNNGTTETDYAYDAAGRQTSSTLDPTGLDRVTTKSYNADDLLVSQRTGDAHGSGTTDYQYNADGAMTGQSVENYATGAPSGWWKLNDGSAGATTPSTARDWSGQNNGGTLNSGVKWASGAASFNGTSGSISTGGTSINTAASYSVSAWVNFAATPTTYSTMVGAPGAHNGAFYLQYSSASGGWAFVTTSADASGETQYASKVAATPAANTWYHLVGVYDASAGTIQLYVNSVAAPAATQTAAWSASHGLSIGSAGSSNYINGQVSDVQVYQRALTAADVKTIYNGGQRGAAVSAPSNTTTWTLDGRDLPLSMTDPNGQTTNYQYDESGRRVVTQQPAVLTGTYSSSGGYTTATVAPTTTTGYDAFGDAAESKDPTGLETVTSFDADGRPTATTLPDYQQPGTTYNSLLTGLKTKTQYNELGQKTSTWNPAGTQTTYAYDQQGRTTSMTLDPGGLNRTTTTGYDTDGDLLQTTDPAGDIQSATYDYLGHTSTSTQVLGLGGAGSKQIPATGCSSYNNVATQAACTTTYQYDQSGFLQHTISQQNVITSYGYNAAGEITNVIDSANQGTIYDYDYAGRQIRTQYPDDTVSTTTYNEAGQIAAEGQYADLGVVQLRSTSVIYDGDGNVLSSTDADKNTTTYTYDAASRLTSETQPASYASTLSQVPSVTQSITTGFGYDAAGRQTKYVTGNGNTSYCTYNAWGLPESSVEPATTAYTTSATSTTTATYDALGNAVEQDAPGGVVKTQTYDTAGELRTQSGSSNNATDAPTATRTFTYYANGLVNTAATSNTATGSTSNATNETFAYDDSGALASATGTAGTSAFTYTADGQMASRADTVAGTTYTAAYSYEPTSGRLSSISDQLTGSTLKYAYTPNSLDYSITYGAGGDVRSFGYNSAHELQSDTLTTPGTNGTTVASIVYGYDPNGNETSKTTTGLTGSTTNTYTYDQANRLKSWNNGTTVTGYAYDQDSNLTTSAGNTYTYDARDELTSDGTNTYAYTARGTLQSTTSATGSATTTSADAFGQIQSDGADSYTYDALGRVVQRGSTAFDYSGTANTLSFDGTTVYSRDPAGSLVADLQSLGNGSFDLTDQHTDVVGHLSPVTGALVGSAAYDPFGKTISTTGHQTALGYQSQYTSPATGKVDMAARWYNPATGQFTSKDSSANSPVPDSANANPFAYGNDNPLTATDPTGHRAFYDDGNNRYAEDAAAVRATFAAVQYEYDDIIGDPLLGKYANTADELCDGRMGCYYGKLRALSTVSVDKTGKLVGSNAAIGILNKVLGTGNEPDDGSRHCSINPLSWGGCVHNVESWIARHPLVKDILSVTVGAATAFLCTAASGGTLVAGCAMLGGAATTGFDYAVTGDATGKGSVSGLLTTMTVGALAAGSSFATSGAVSGTLEAGAKALLGDSVAADTVSGALTGGVSGGVGGAVLGAGSYASTCGSDGGNCSWSGLVKATLSTAAVAAVGGAALGGIAAGSGSSVAAQTTRAQAGKTAIGAGSDPGVEEPILWGQARISADYSNSEKAPDYLRGRNIYDVANDLMAKPPRLSPDQFRVVAFRYNGKLITNNNRSLAVLSLAGLRPTNLIILNTQAEIDAAIANGDVDSDIIERLSEPTPLGDTLPANRIAVTPSQRNWKIDDIIDGL